MAFSNQFSRFFGRFANHRFPSVIQKFINTLYVKIFDIDLSDFAPIEHYESLNALFTRSLKNKRDFDNAKDTLIAPCDSLITECAKVSSGMALQIKGMSYRVGELLGIDDGTGEAKIETIDALEAGYEYINFYLSPRDYHRYHAPCDLKVIEVRYFSGVLLPVNMPSLRKNQDLFIKNERVVVVAKDPMGEMLYFVAVGALNVGQMVLHFEPRVQTNRDFKNAIYRYDSPICVAKGEELGLFKMGSTIVVFAKNLKSHCAPDLKVRFGDTIATFICEDRQN
ncbi:phosphatidylserine decarboxylase [Helicobacter sp. 11S02596-1]|uniref:phosphatidylserine decarboxylase n=1 Tax=Helicobacter sp. 11S02596-1 TaxID=1476194 RepID=UPI000BA79D28|nr:phosphatidylserine decarboxylase [Helicobacter sp. 11S02596-1]PAF44311.1 phosphatidylserine decarboxylase [Helicobacter sp. 11S02596-1]